MRGRKIASDAEKLHKAAGLRAERDELSECVGLPVQPDWLDAIAAAEWVRVLPLLQASGLATALDTATITVYCVSWSRWVQASQMIKEQGAVYQNGNVLRQHPAVVVAKESAVTLLRAAAELGLTSMARKKLGSASTEAETPKKQALSDFIAEGKLKVHGA